MLSYAIYVGPVLLSSPSAGNRVICCLCCSEIKRVEVHILLFVSIVNLFGPYRMQRFFFIKINGYQWLKLLASSSDLISTLCLVRLMLGSRFGPLRIPSLSVR